MDPAERLPVLGFPGYAVARDHTVWSRRRGEWRRLALFPRPGKGACAHLSRHGRTFELAVARLVREAFGPGSLVAGKRPSGRSPGRRHGRAVLNEYKVQEARVLKAKGWTYPELVRHFGVSKSTLYHAISGRTWGHVAPLPPCEIAPRSQPSPV